MLPSKILRISFLLFISFLSALVVYLLFGYSRVRAQVPPPYVPCNQVRSPEFHSLRPYQASPCNNDATELALYCGSSFILTDTFSIFKTFENPPYDWEYTYEGNPIDPVPPEDSFNQRACNYCSGDTCVSGPRPCIPDLDQCASSADCFQSCMNNLDGTETCTFLVARHREVAIDLSDAEFPIMGNTDDVVNSQNQYGSLPYDAFDVPEPLDAYDPTKVNEYVSWYLNGIIGRAEYEPLDPDDPNDVLKITDFSGPIKKFLSFESQITDRINEAQRARTSRNCNPNAVPRDPECIRHDQVVGCSDSAGRPVECYPQRGGVTERRLTNWIGNFPPLRQDYTDWSDYWQAYTNWRNGNPRFIGNLFTYIPFSSTEDRRGLVEAVFQTIQPVQPYVRIVSATLTQVPADLFFAHIQETAELGETLQMTFAFQGAELAGQPSNIAPQANPFCDLVEVRSNPGDDLFATELLITIDYTAQVECTFLIPYLLPSPAPGVPPGNVCENLAGGTCQLVPPLYDCDSFFGPVDCDVSFDCAVNCTPLPSGEICDTDLGKQCYPDDWLSCSGVENSTFGCPGGYDWYCGPGGIAPGVCPPWLPPNSCDVSTCPGGFTCASSCTRPIDPPTLEQECPITVNVMIGTVTETPKADELWSRFVAGPAGVFRRVFPKIEPGAPIEAIWDIPAATRVTFTSDGGVTYVGIPGSGRTQPELYFPHIGGIHQYFLKCIQRALRPQGFGEACLSGSPGTNAPPSGDCPSVPDSAVPSKWLGNMKTHFIWAADVWCGGVGENMAEECYNYVVTESIAAGVNPAFSLTIWLNETAASNYECSGQTAQDFGINDASIYMNLVAQLERFLGLPYSSTYLFCRSQAQSRGLDPMFGGFLDRFRDGNCDMIASNTNAGWVYYNNLKSFTWPLVTEPLRNCVTSWFGILWPTDFACP